MNNQLPYIAHDEPLDKDPQFGFEGYAKTIADIIANPENHTPLVLGIYGTWGSGKTTLMKTVQDRLGQHERTIPYRSCKTVWFQAWKHAEEDAIFSALIEEIFKSMDENHFFTQSKPAIEKIIESCNAKHAFSDFVKALSDKTVDIGMWFSSLEHKTKLGFHDGVQQLFDQLLWSYLRSSGQETNQAFSDRDGVLVVFIDDLDRCPNDCVLRVLETMKLFLNKTGCVFVIGAVREVIESALQQRYDKPGEVQQFMDKMMQVTFALPTVSDDELKGFLSTCAPEDSILQAFTPTLGRMLNHNVRAIKRFINELSISQGLLLNTPPLLDIPLNILIRWRIVQYAYPRWAELIKVSPQHILAMNETVNALEESGLQSSNWNISDKKVKDVPIPASLREFVAKRELVDLLEGFPVQVPVLERIVRLSMTATNVSEDIQAQRAQDFDREMATVPQGLFCYGDNKVSITIAYDYLVGIYPVTNEQYRQFMESRGYHEKELWLEEGWAWKEQANIFQPRYWDDAQWNKEGHPVVGVSWYEADAYARWVGKRLPMEEEWEKAACGVDGRDYPWGGQFDGEKCNSLESGIGGTTPVMKHVNGLGPYGCYDMAGNVLEWTQSWHEKDPALKVLRGGSWVNDTWELRSANQYVYLPTVRFNDVGFRCVQDIRRP
ncbi:MAG: SUMF1/EgtB/PvdO family nonheme iron enzyme [Nitrospirales bacterium]|nr:SUMF1/EgtB/PvdO family nonheme iron enzyme [Nitrospirales bacterium]